MRNDPPLVPEVVVAKANRGAPLTLRESALVMGISTTRAGALEQKACLKLRKLLGTQMGITK